MIITEATPQSPLKPRESSPLIGQEPLNSPPAYVQHQQFLSSSNPRPEYRRSPRRRFLKAFCVAVVIFFLLSVFTSSVVWISKDKAPRAKVRMASHDTRDGPVQSNGFQRCVEGRDWSQSIPPGSSQYPQSARVVFDLPVSSDALYFLARGSLAHGSFKVSDLDEAGDMVKIEVVVSYYTQEALDRAKVCSLQRKSRENGFGIFTPEHWKHSSNKDQLRFDVVVRLPVKHSHLVVHAFETELPMFSQTVGDIAKTVEFRRLSLMGSNMPITVTSLHAHRARLTTSNSPIIGSFNTSRSLELRTSNSPITVNVNLLNDPVRKATDLILATSNGPIDSTICLTSSKITGGSFNVNATTSNQPVKLKYDASPIDSILYSRVHTCNSPATVSHHSAFEGVISLVSTIFSPSIDKKDVEDPSGQGRHRSLEVARVVRGVVMGVVYWGTEKKEVTGFTEIKTTNSPAYLQV